MKKKNLDLASLFAMSIAMAPPPMLNHFGHRRFRDERVIKSCARRVCTNPNTSGKDYCSAECCKLDREEAKAARGKHERK